MGGFVDKVFGGGGAKEASKSMDWLKDVYNWGQSSAQPFVTGGTGAFNMMNGLLGVGGTQAQTDAFNNFMNSTGMQFLLDEGSKAITGNMAARGLLKSGATAKALTQYGQNLASTKITDMMKMLQGQAELGENAIGAVMGAGSNIGSTLGQLGQAKAQDKADAWGSLFNLAMSAASLSDRRLKTAVEKVGEFANGLGLYIYRYVWGGPLQWGVMAHEVAEKQPEALGPVINGFQTVNYAMLRS